MALSNEVQAWREAGKHLPDILSDFHDQKDLFATMHWMMGPPEDGCLVRTPNEVEGHCYVVDRFLWFMARHGYTLQRSRTRLNFDDLQSNVDAMRAKRLQDFASIMGAPVNGDSVKASADTVASVGLGDLSDKGPKV